jgi:hypothetical protein
MITNTTQPAASSVPTGRCPGDGDDGRGEQEGEQEGEPGSALAGELIMPATMVTPSLQIPASRARLCAELMMPAGRAVIIACWPPGSADSRRTVPAPFRATGLLP